MKNLTIVALSGIGASGISMRSLAAIKAADTVLCQTIDHPTAELVNGYPSMDDLYAKASDYDELNSAIVERILSSKGENVVYAVLGGNINEALYDTLKCRCANIGIKLNIMPAAGFSDYALAAIGACNESTLKGKANALPSELNPYIPLAVEEVDNQLLAGELKLSLLEYYPDEYPICIARLNKDCEYSIEQIKLFELDRQTSYSADCVVYVPSADMLQLKRHSINDLMRVLWRLREPNGCPWDKEQTHTSLKKTLIEEAYEVIDAIDNENEVDLCEELGDVMLQVAFHAIIEEEKSSFTLRDITTEVVNKLIYRHPHVFGNEKADTTDEVLANWEVLKRNEKKQRTQEEAIAAVPKSFPALLRSAKIQKKAADVNFDFANAHDAFVKIREETDELTRAMNGDGDIAEELGDLLFAVVNVARLLKLDPELCLTAATDKFADRFIKMERLILSDGKKITEMSLPEMDKYWALVKEAPKTC